MTTQQREKQQHLLFERLQFEHQANFQMAGHPIFGDGVFCQSLLLESKIQTHLFGLCGQKFGKKESALFLLERLFAELV
jgi:hypothetical protein